MGEPGKKRVFWIDNFKGQPDAAYPFRCDLKESIEKLESLTNKKVVGIIYDKTHTIELLTEKKDTNERE
jgi:hypothetical protein|tara:strand:+ start:560 stop:766 length:207 start_codon:yes stop_codon:yes gene_type:complete